MWNMGWGHWQGLQTSHRDMRENVSNPQRTTVVHNLHVISHLSTFAMAA